MAADTGAVIASKISTAMEITFFLVAINVVLGALAALWLVLGLRTFDAGMAGEPAGAKRKW